VSQQWGSPCYTLPFWLPLHILQWVTTLTYSCKNHVGTCTCTHLGLKHLAKLSWVYTLQVKHSNSAHHQQQVRPVLVQSSCTADAQTKHNTKMLGPDRHMWPTEKLLYNDVMVQTVKFPFSG
jgi:hypothetical protein